MTYQTGQRVRYLADRALHATVIGVHDDGTAEIRIDESMLTVEDTRLCEDDEQPDVPEPVRDHPITEVSDDA